MKKLVALLLVLVMVFSFAACTEDPAKTSGETNTETTEATTGAAQTGETLTTYAEFVAAADQTKVVVETYVQATQSWWDNKITAYTQNEEGAYFLYEMACTQEDAARLVPGTKIRVTGYKTTWEGEMEIIDATFEFVAGGNTFVATPKDATALLGTEDLVKDQNKLVTFKGMTVVSIAYKGEGDDIYLTVSKNGAEYSFCVEKYLTGPETAVYQAVGALQAGNVIDITGFLYWYQGANPHVTAVSAAA